MPAMAGEPRIREGSALRRDVYRLFLALTRLVIDPLLASQAPEAALLDLAAGQTSIAD
jgi:hypothetical protein